MGILEVSEKQFELVRKAFNTFRENYPEAAASTEYQELVTYTTLFFGNIRSDINDMKNIAQIGKIEDVLKELNSLRTLIRVDPVTKLKNRRAYDEDIFYHSEFAVRHKHPLALIRADIDNFGNVNDTYGHKAGDMVLQGHAYLLNQSIRHTDKAYRLGDGSDELAIILPETELYEAMKVAERFNEAARTKTYELKGRKIGPITVTQGIDIYNPKDASDDYRVVALEIDENADEIGNIAKKEGRRNSINVYATKVGDCGLKL
jgi:diguanylate cyclase (GGDEF)-like protein